MKVLVCGGRDYADYNRLREVLDVQHAGHPITLLINGKAPGADMLAWHWAIGRGIETRDFPAKWGSYHGNRAGPIRNRRMLTVGRPELVIAFPGGKGTRDMIAIAEEASVLVRRVS